MVTISQQTLQQFSLQQNFRSFLNNYTDEKATLNSLQVVRMLQTLADNQVKKLTLLSCFIKEQKIKYVLDDQILLLKLLKTEANSQLKLEDRIRNLQTKLKQQLYQNKEQQNPIKLIDLYTKTAKNNMKKNIQQINEHINLHKFENAVAQIKSFSKSFSGEQCASETIKIYQTIGEAIQANLVNQTEKKIISQALQRLCMVNFQNETNAISTCQINLNIIKPEFKRIRSKYLINQPNENKNKIGLNVLQKLQKMHINLIEFFKQKSQTNNKFGQQKAIQQKTRQEESKYYTQVIKRQESQIKELIQNKEQLNKLKLKLKLVCQKMNSLNKKIARKLQWKSDLQNLKVYHQFSDSQLLKEFIQFGLSTIQFYENKMKNQSGKISNCMTAVKQIIQNKSISISRRTEQLERKIINLNHKSGIFKEVSSEILDLIKSLFQQVRDNLEQKDSLFLSNKSQKNYRSISLLKKSTQGQLQSRFTESKNNSSCSINKLINKRKNDCSIQAGTVSTINENNVSTKQLTHKMQIIFNSITAVMVYGQGNLTARFEQLKCPTQIIRKYPQYENIFKIIRNWLKTFLPRFLNNLSA